MPLIAPPAALATLLMNATGTSLEELLGVKEDHDSAFSRKLRNVAARRHKPRDRTISQIQTKIDELDSVRTAGATVNFRKVIKGGVEGDATPTWKSNHQVWLSEIGAPPGSFWQLATFWREAIELEWQSHEAEALIESGRHTDAIELLRKHRLAVLPSVLRILQLADPQRPNDEFRDTLAQLHIVTCLYLLACVIVDSPVPRLGVALIPHRDRDGKIQKSAKLWYEMQRSELRELSLSEFYDCLNPPGSSGKEESRREVRRWIRESRIPPKIRLPKLIKTIADFHAKQRPDLNRREELQAYIRFTIVSAQILDELLRKAESLATGGNLKGQFDPIAIFKDFSLLHREAQDRKIAGTD
jgi:hypothetical protein